MKDLVDDPEYWEQFVTEQRVVQSPKVTQDLFDTLVGTLSRYERRSLACTSTFKGDIRPELVTTRRTRRGRLRNEAMELYLQSLLGCGISGCPKCEEEDWKLNMDEPLVILDADVVEHELDFLWDDECINNCVVLQSISERVRKKNRRAYNRMLRLCGIEDRKFDGFELPNDRRFHLFPNIFFHETFVQNGDSVKLVQKAATWYHQHILEDDTLEHSRKVILLTRTDSSALKNGLNPSIQVLTLSEYLASKEALFPGSGQKLKMLLPCAEVVDIIPDSMKGLVDEFSLTVKKSFEYFYDLHRDPTSLANIIEAGTAFQGEIRMSRTSCWKATVVVKSPRLEIRVLGRKNINRAVDKDIVVVELIKDAKRRNIAAAEDCRLDGVNEIVENFEKEEHQVQMIEQAEYLGAVVGIVSRNWRMYSGSLRPRKCSPSGNHTYEDRLFIPSIAYIPPIKIRTRSGNNELDGRRLVVSIDSWDRSSIHPRGHWVEDMGPAGHYKTEARVILREHEIIFREFSAKVMRCLPAQDYQANTDAQGRLDLRLKYCFCDTCLSQRRNEPPKHSTHPKFPELYGTPCYYSQYGFLNEKEKQILPLTHWSREDPHAFPGHLKVSKIRQTNPDWEEYTDHGNSGTIACSIDPLTCVDIDDALSVRYMPNGNYEIAVHIADVTHYVKPDTALDSEAAERCTSVYLVDQRTDMLPARLSSDICSLKAGVDRLAFSVFWEMDAKANVIRSWFNKTIIHSVAALEYKQAQTLIDDETNNSPLAIRLRVLNNLAKIIRQRRLDSGGLVLASNDVKFELDDEGNPVAVEPYPTYETNNLVEDFMLLANITVAEKITQAYPEVSVLRRHPTPKTESLAALANVLATRKIHFKFGDSKELAESLNNAHIPNDPLFNKLLRYITVQCMNRACYFSSGDVRDEQARKHYALAAKLYTHFTSPIRR